MSISSLSSFGIYDYDPGLIKQRTAAAGVQTTRKTDAAGETPERSTFLEEVRRRVLGGHYASSEVIEDLSDTFARAFDKTI